jgi:hypothetical protein
MSKYFTFINEVQMTGHVSLSLSTPREKNERKTKTNCFWLLTCILTNLPSGSTTSNHHCKSMVVILRGYGIVTQKDSSFEPLGFDRP